VVLVVGSHLLPQTLRAIKPEQLTKVFREALYPLGVEVKELVRVVVVLVQLVLTGLAELQMEQMVETVFPQA
jgi:Mg2+/Co2+ transporter CorB